MFFETYSTMYNWGLDVIRIIQTYANPVLTFLCNAFSFIGSPVFIIATGIILIWAVDEKKGFEFFALSAFSLGVNEVIKHKLKVPRPYVIDPRLKMVQETGYSTPSGHAQNAVIFWPFFAKYIGAAKKNFNILARILIAVLMILLISASRLYLGVHYPSDLLFGWIAGLVIFCLYAFLWEKLSPLVKKLPQSLKILIGFVPCYLLLCIDNTQLKMPAFLFGLTVGKVYITKNGGFSAKDGTLLQKILRIPVGLAGAAAIYYALEFGKKFVEISRYAYFIQFALLGVWLTFGAPAVFKFLKLTALTVSENFDGKTENEGNEND